MPKDFVRYSPVTSHGCPTVVSPWHPLKCGPSVCFFLAVLVVVLKKVTTYAGAFLLCRGSGSSIDHFRLSSFLCRDHHCNQSLKSRRANNMFGTCSTKQVYRDSASGLAPRATPELACHDVVTSAETEVIRHPTPASRHSASNTDSCLWVVISIISDAVPHFHNRNTKTYLP